MSLERNPGQYEGLPIGNVMRALGAKALPPRHVPLAEQVAALNAAQYGSADAKVALMVQRIPAIARAVGDVDLSRDAAIDSDDATQAAIVGILQGINRIDSYAADTLSTKIEAHARAGIRRMEPKQPGRPAIADNDENADTAPEYSAQVNEREAAVRDLVDPEPAADYRMSYRERRILELRFGLEEGVAPKTVKEVAKVFNVTDSYMRSLIKKTLDKLAGQPEAEALRHMADIDVTSQVNMGLPKAPKVLSGPRYYSPEETRQLKYEAWRREEAAQIAAEAEAAAEANIEVHAWLAELAARQEDGEAVFVQGNLLQGKQHPAVTKFLATSYSNRGAALRKIQHPEDAAVSPQERDEQRLERRISDLERGAQIAKDELDDLRARRR